MKQYSVIIAARSGSTRLPGKALLPLKEVPMITFLIRRLKTSEKVKKIILATTELKTDDILAKAAENEDIKVFRGNENDVVKRFVDTASIEKIEYVVRVTADCPFVDGYTLDYCIDKCDQYGLFDLATTKTCFPVGIDFEIYNAITMEKLHNDHSLTKDEREHLTLPIYNRADQFNILYIVPPDFWPKPIVALTVDTRDDYYLAKKITGNFKDIYFSVESLLSYCSYEFD